MTEPSSFEDRVTGFTETLLGEMGLALDVSLEKMTDGLRINLNGDGAEALLRRKGEGLDALQHLVNCVFRDEVPGEQRLVIDCQGFRKAKDRELQQMARYLMERARATGMPQELGPLNSYARRLVHLEVSSAPDLLSESHGEGAMKRVVISRK
jgi:spoIIIJ-associated protein